MDRCVLLTSTPEGIVSPAGRSRGRTGPWIIPIITWCWKFPSLSTNILLIKNKLKLESRAIVVGVAMSPRNLGGKYSCRPHPRWRKCMRQVFFGFFSGKHSVSIELRQSGVIAWRPHRRSCGVFKGWISVTHCPFQRKWRVLHIRYISVLEQVGVSFNGIAYLMKVCAFVQAGVPSCSDDVTHRSCANFKCEVADDNIGGIWSTISW